MIFALLIWFIRSTFCNIETDLFQLKLNSSFSYYPVIFPMHVKVAAIQTINFDYCLVENALLLQFKMFATHKVTTTLTILLYIFFGNSSRLNPSLLVLKVSIIFHLFPSRIQPFLQTCSKHVHKSILRKKPLPNSIKKDAISTSHHETVRQTKMEIFSPRKKNWNYNASEFYINLNCTSQPHSSLTQFPFTCMLSFSLVPFTKKDLQKDHTTTTLIIITLYKNTLFFSYLLFSFNFHANHHTMLCYIPCSLSPSLFYFPLNLISHSSSWSTNWERVLGSTRLCV